MPRVGQVKKAVAYVRNTKAVTYVKNSKVGRYATDAAKSVYGTYSGIAKNTINGAKIGRESAKANGDNVIKSTYKIIREAIKNNKITKDDIPALMGGFGAVAGGAIPGSTTVGYTIGLLIKKGLSLFTKK